jgi:hypothetical protein
VTFEVVARPSRDNENHATGLGGRGYEEELARLTPPTGCEAGGDIFRVEASQALGDGDVERTFR